jgi:hypothetical protein
MAWTSSTDGANRLFGSHRCHGNGFHKSIAIEFKKDPIIFLYVGNDHRLPMDHRPSADASRSGKLLALPQRPNRIVLDVMAEIALAAYDGDALASYQRSRCCAQRFHHVFEALRASHLRDSRVECRQRCRNPGWSNYAWSVFARIGHCHSCIWARAKHLLAARALTVCERWR